MKARERHQLKENEFVVMANQAMDMFNQNRNTAIAIGAAIVLIVALAGGYFYMQNRAAEGANALLGAALTIENSPIVPAPTVPGATQAAGTFPTEAARGDAAIAAFQKVIDEYPSNDLATAARYHMGAVYMSLGRPADAEKAFAEAGAQGSSLYAQMAKLGQAQALVAESKFDEAIAILTDLSALRDTPLPIDGVLIELARTNRKAGKTDEAKAAFKRVVDEFPESVYASEARQQLDTMG